MSAGRADHFSDVAGGYMGVAQRTAAAIRMSHDHRGSLRRVTQRADLGGNTRNRQLTETCTRRSIPSSTAREARLPRRRCALASTKSRPTISVRSPSDCPVLTRPRSHAMTSSFTVHDASGYEQLMGRWSQRLAPRFIDFAGLAAGEKIL